MNNITPSLFSMYHICKREMWLHAKEIRMEQTSDLVYEGRIIGENSYPQRPEKYTELQLEYAKIDFYDAKNKVVHEVKKSDKMEHAHIAQVQYYLYLLEKEMGIKSPSGLLEYPKLRETQKIEPLSEVDFKSIELKIKDIQKILNSECPLRIANKSYCKSCSYFEFC